MSGGRYEVEPEALDALAVLVEGQAAALNAEAGRFEGPATEVGDAFGWLGPSSDILRDYLELATGCVGALRELECTLDSITAGLRSNADWYRAAETANTAGG